MGHGVVTRGSITGPLTPIKCVTIYFLDSVDLERVGVGTQGALPPTPRPRWSLVSRYGLRGTVLTQTS